MAFKLRSQGSSFKMMGSSPVKQPKKGVKKIMKKISQSRSRPSSPISQKLPIASSIPAFDLAYLGHETLYDVETDTSKTSMVEKIKKHTKQNVGETILGYLEGPVTEITRAIFPSIDLPKYVPEEYGGTKKKKIGKKGK